MPQLKVEKNCPLCLSNKKKTVKLKLLRMNFTQGTIVCPTKNCPYPLTEGCMDDFVTLDPLPEMDLSAGTEASSGDSWCSILEEINKIVIPGNDLGDIIKQVDQSTDNLAQENGLEEFSSYASDFIDSFVKECELKYSKSNQDLREPPSYDLENKSMNSSMLEFDLNLGSLAISTPSGEAFNSLDALTSLDFLNDSDMQTELDESEESNSRNNTSAILVGKNSVLENNSKNTSDEYSANVVQNADMQTEPAENNSSSNTTTTTAVFEDLVLENNSKNINNENTVDTNKNADTSLMPNDVISSLNELQNNSQLEPVHCIRDNSLISSDASSNKVDSKDSGSIGSNIASTGKMCKLSCGTGTTLSKTVSDEQSGETIHVSNEMQTDELNTEMLPAGSCELNNQAVNYEEMEFIYLPDEAQVSTENQPISVRRDEVEQHNSIVIIFDANGSSSVVQVGELDDIAGAIKQGKTCDSNGLMKDSQKGCEVDNIGSANRQSNKCDTKSLLKDRQQVCEVDNIGGAIKQGNIRNANGLMKDHQQVCEVDNIGGALIQGNICNTKSLLKDRQQVCEVDSIGGAIKQGSIRNANGLMKDHQEGCVDDIASAIKQGNICNSSPMINHEKVINTNTGVSTAARVSGQGGTSVQICEGQSSNEKGDSRLLNINRLTEDEINACSINLPVSGIGKSQDLSESKSLQASMDSQPLSECSIENVSSSPIEKETSCKIDNKAKGRTKKNIKNTPPKVLIKSQMCTRSSTRKQMNSPNSNNDKDCKNAKSGNGNPQNNNNGKGSVLNVYSKNSNKEKKTNVISQMSSEQQNDSKVKNALHRDPDTTDPNEANIDCINGNKSDNTLDLPFKHISNAVVSDGSSFTLEKSLFSLILDDFELSPQKTEFSTSYNRYSMSYKSALIDPKNSSAGMKDDFVVRKPQWKNGVDRSRRRSARNIKTIGETSSICLNDKESETAESDTPNELTSVATNDDNTDKLVVKVTGNDVENSSARMKDLEKPQWTISIDCSRRLSTRNIKTSTPISGTSSMCLDKKENKTKESDTPNELTSVATIDDDNTDKPFTKMTGNGALENSSVRMKDDDFVVQKPRSSIGVGRSRRQSTRNIKTSSPISGTSSLCLNDKKGNETEESDSPCALPSIFTIDDDYIDKPVVNVASNDDAKNVKNQPDDTYKHSNYTYNKNSYQCAKVVKNVKFRRVTRSSELVLTKINTRKTLSKKI